MNESLNIFDEQEFHNYINQKNKEDEDKFIQCHKDICPVFWLDDFECICYQK